MLKFKQKTKKFKELILYISEKCATDPHFGAIKLNKILFLSDFWSYGRFGEPITGVQYMRLKLGPVPRPLLPVRKEMEDNGELALQETTLDPNIAQKRTVNLRSADLSVFGAEEIALVDQIIDMCKCATGAGLSRYTHEWHGWMVAEDKETIPYEIVFISDEPMTAFEAARGKELATQYGWQV